MTEQTKLLPCPCCEAENVRLVDEAIVSFAKVIAFYVECENCGMRTVSDPDKDVVVEVWNRRPKPRTNFEAWKEGAWVAKSEDCDVFQNVDDNFMSVLTIGVAEYLARIHNVRDQLERRGVKDDVLEVEIALAQKVLATLFTKNFKLVTEANNE